MKSIAPTGSRSWIGHPGSTTPERENDEMQNLALGKPATQSSVSEWSAFKSPEKDARGANNGIVDGNHGFHTEKETIPWWQVDLEGICSLIEVVLYNRQSNPDRLRHFSILASLDGKQWVELFRKTDDQHFGGTGIDPYVARLPEGSAGRFVRIQCNATDYLHFCECQVFGQNADPQQVAALEARFAAFVASEERRMCDPRQLEDPKDLDIELALSHGLHPFPDYELSRNWGRRWILDYVPEGTIGAEVGVFRGHFSELILRRQKPKKLYLIDPWRKLLLWRSLHEQTATADRAGPARR